MRRIALQTACAVVLLWATNARAYPSHDDGAGTGCVQCHVGFESGTGVLHQRHRIDFGVTTCNVCHPSGGGTTPVLTYFSGTGGGLGCAGCHGQDYGHTSPNSGQAKATSYGLRLFHANNGVTVCATCHFPGSGVTGEPMPAPAILPENVAPPYYTPTYSNLTDACASAEEDLTSDVDSIGLDNDGDGAADFPADSDCAAATTTTTTTTLPFVCGPAPVGGCIASGKAKLLVNEKTAGKEKLKASLKSLQATVTPAHYGDPVTGSTSYKVCIYDAANQLSGEYVVARAGDTCGDAPCWSAVSGKGFKYTDKSTAADGILKMLLYGGDAGKGKIKVIGKNSSATMPTGVAAALQGEVSATVQVVSSDASCFDAALPEVKKADGAVFSADGP